MGCEKENPGVLILRYIYQQAENLSADYISFNLRGSRPLHYVLPPNVRTGN